MSMDIHDLRGHPDSISSCCGAQVTSSGMCADCGEHCEDEADYDPTPYCSGCKAMTSDKCKCGPIAANE